MSHCLLKNVRKGTLKSWVKTDGLCLKSMTLYKEETFSLGVSLTLKLAIQSSSLNSTQLDSMEILKCLSIKLIICGFLYNNLCNNYTINCHNKKLITFYESYFPLSLIICAKNCMEEKKWFRNFYFNSLNHIAICFSREYVLSALKRVSLRAYYYLWHSPFSLIPQ